MKNPKPSQKDKKRYLRFKVHSNQKRELGEIVEAIWASSLNYNGAKGTSEIDFWIIGNKFNEDKQEGVIKVNRNRENEFRAALCLINNIGGEKGFISVEESSGIIDGLSSI